MTTSKNFKTILTSLGMPIVFSVSLMTVALISIAPIFLGVNERFTYGIFGTLVAFLTIFVFLKIDRQSWKDYFLTIDKKTFVRIVKGSLFGFLIAASMFLLQTWYSGLEISFTGASFSQFAIMSLSLLPLAFMEELAFRSYPFFKLKNAFGVWSAQIVIAVLFALYHYVGGWSLLASFIGPGVWSIAFGLLALRSNGIALPTGFHFGLNLALATIGNKPWVPGLISIDFASTPSEEMLKSNEYFGGLLQLSLLAVLLVLTYLYTRNIHGKKQSN
ncbi:lysostaphin resistance A-like protein [Ekhidna sp.]